MTDEEIAAVLDERIRGVRRRISDAAERAGRNPADITLVAVTKTVSVRVAVMAVRAGLTDLGESRPQELERKASSVPGAVSPTAVRFHQIGHLQRNKVDKVVRSAVWIHSIDSDRLFDAVAAEARACQRRPQLLLQVNASNEEQKHGFTAESIGAMRDRVADTALAVDVVGLMGMAALTEDHDRIQATFRDLRILRDELQQRWGKPLPHLSMGMSGDFEMAVEQGATLVRIGSTLFEGLEAA